MERSTGGRFSMALLMLALSSPVFAVDSDDFVDKATQGGIAEVEAGKLALEKSTAKDVKAFANQMIKDHGAANHDLAALAKKLDLKVPDDAELTAHP